MTTETTSPHPTEAPPLDELQTLREHNKKLLGELKAARAEAKQTGTDLQAASTEAAKWHAEWHKAAVLAPLDTALADTCAVPVRYLREELIERGILKLQPDAEGIERPTWFTLDGEPAQPTDLRKFLSDMHDPELMKMLRGTGATGMGGGSISGPIGQRFVSSEKPAAPSPPAPTFGLR